MVESIKFKLRRAKIQELEAEQEREDLASLTITDEQRDLLVRTFACVKAEFEDLDGLSWEGDGAKEIMQDWVRPSPFST